jgi:hypothetical protein
VFVAIAEICTDAFCYSAVRSGCGLAHGFYGDDNRRSMQRHLHQLGRIWCPEIDSFNAIVVSIILENLHYADYYVE